MPTGDVYRVSLEGRNCGEPNSIGLGFVSNSGAADFTTDAQQLADEVNSALGLGVGLPGGFMEPLSVQYTLLQLRVQDVNPGLAGGFTMAFGSPGGNATDDAMPPNDSLCVTWRTALKGTPNRGRSYLAGFAEDSANGGYWINEIQLWALNNFGNALMAAFGPAGTGNYVLSLIHTQSGGAPIVPPTATPITSFSVHNEVRTLRRRAIGVRISRRPSGA